MEGVPSVRRKPDVCFGGSLSFGTHQSTRASIDYPRSGWFGLHPDPSLVILAMIASVEAICYERKKSSPSRTFRTELIRSIATAHGQQGSYYHWVERREKPERSADDGIFGGLRI
jgi:hypothetical protein